jgi:hypothetical protein
MVLVAFHCRPAGAENIVYPPNSGIIDVVRQYGIDNSGIADVTDTLNAIILNTVGWRVIYLPGGTYRVTGPVSAEICEEGKGIAGGPVIQGQGRNKTIIRLDDGVWPSSLPYPSDPQTRRSRVVLSIGECGNRSFDKGLHNLTVNIGKNNAGAIGVRFNASNSGCMSEVDIVSGDGRGMIGLDLGGQENGPAFVRDVRVQGFAVGIRAEAGCSITMSSICVEAQGRIGMESIWRTYVDSFVSANRVPSIRNTGDLVLVGARLAGGAPNNAGIENRGKLYAQSIVAEGYRTAIASVSGSTKPPKALQVAEFSSHGVAGNPSGLQGSDHISPKRAPIPAWEQDPSKWANVADFKGRGVGYPVVTDQRAFQTALSAAGKTSIVVPGGMFYHLPDTLHVSGDVSRVVGTGNNCGVLVVDEGSAPVVMIQRLRGTVINRSSRAVIIESVGGTAVAQGPGDLFVSDHCGRMEILNQQAHVWARQLNIEYDRVSADSSLFDMANGAAWVLGYKSEGVFGKVYLSGGRLELYGLLQYNSMRPTEDGTSLVRIKGGTFFVAMVTQITHGNNMPFSRLVSDTRNNASTVLLSSRNPTGPDLPAYFSAPVQ